MRAPKRSKKAYSSYGNQIGLATGKVSEVYHPGYVAKRMEVGAVISATPRKNVFRGSPATGDVILLIGGRTGRDGVGGATGSSKEHTDTALENSAEVQKGDPPTERKIQRLFPRRFAKVGLPITGVYVQPLGGRVLAPDQGFGQAMIMVDVIKTKAPFDTQPTLVCRPIDAFNIFDLPVLHLQ